MFNTTPALALLRRAYFGRYPGLTNPGYLAKWEKVSDGVAGLKKLIK